MAIHNSFFQRVVGKIRTVWKKISLPEHKTKRELAAIIFLLLIIPFTIVASQRIQDTRQRAEIAPVEPETKHLCSITESDSGLPAKTCTTNNGCQGYQFQQYNSWEDVDDDGKLTDKDKIWCDYTVCMAPWTYCPPRVNPPDASASASIAPGQPVSGPNLGVQLPNGDAVERLKRSNYGGVGWVKYQYSWTKAVAKDPNQDIVKWVKQAKDAGYKVMLSVAKKPENGLEGDDYQAFGEFMKKTASDLKGQVDAYEIWNEPNLNDEWKGWDNKPNVQNYIKLLKAGAAGVKAGDSNAKVITAGLAPLSADYGSGGNGDEAFFNDFIRIANAEALKDVDAFGWHPEITEPNLPPDNPSDRGFQRVKIALGHGKPVWLTEFGWNRQKAKIDRDTQDQYIRDAYNTVAPSLASSPNNIQVMIVWNFGFTRELSNGGFDPDFQWWDVERYNPTMGGKTPKPDSFCAEGEFQTGVNVRGLVHYGKGDIMPSATATQQDEILAEAHRLGFTVIRVFAANKDITDTEASRRLREFLKKAADKKISVVIALIDEYDNGFHPKSTSKFYGKDFYINQQWALPTEFFKSGYKDTFLPFVRTIVSENKDSKNIYAWEIGNELFTRDTPTLISFVNDVSQTIRSVDPFHPIATGFISAKSLGTSPSDLYGKMDNIDIVTIHPYENARGAFDNAEVGDIQWAVSNEKKGIVEEFGIQGNNRANTLETQLNYWKGNNASALLYWGFLGKVSSDNNDGDRAFGMDKIFSGHAADYDALAKAFQKFACKTISTSITPINSAPGVLDPPSITDAKCVTNSVSGAELQIKWVPAQGTIPKEYAIRIDKDPSSWKGKTGDGDKNDDHVSEKEYKWCAVPGAKYDIWVESVDNQGNHSSNSDKKRVECPKGTPKPTTGTQVQAKGINPSDECNTDSSPTSRPTNGPTKQPTNNPTRQPTGTTPNPTRTSR